MILDSRGRLFGKINLLDLLALFFLLCLAGTVRYAVGASRHHSLKLFSAEPRRIVAGGGKYLMIKGTGFDRSTTIRLGRYPDRGEVYFDESTLGIEIDQRVDPGFYHVRVRDGRGRFAEFPEPVEVIWEPRVKEVKPKILYSTGNDWNLLISGEYFSHPSTVRIQNRELTVNGTKFDAINASLNPEDAPLPLGKFMLQVTRSGGLPTRLQYPVTVVPAQRITSFEPKVLAVGQSVDLVIHGDNFQEHTLVWLGDQLIGEATLENPNLLRIHVNPTQQMIGLRDLQVRLRDGPEIPPIWNAVQIQEILMVSVVVDLQLDKAGESSLERLQESSEVKQIRSVVSKGSTIIEVMLPATSKSQNGEIQYLYQRQLLKKDVPVFMIIHGERVSGVVCSGPFPILMDDEVTH